MWLALGQPWSLLAEHMLHWKWVMGQHAPVKTSHIFLCGMWASKTPLCNYLLFLCKMVRIFSYISVILLTSGRFTLLPSTNSLQTKPGTNSRTRKQHTGSALVVAASYPQHWGFLSVFYTSASVHSALPLSFRCSARLLSWPFSAVWGHLFLTFLAGSYPTSFHDQLLLCCSDWWSDSQLCPGAWFVRASHL